MNTKDNLPSARVFRQTPKYRLNFDTIFRQKPIVNCCKLCQEEQDAWPKCQRADCPNEYKGAPCQS